MSVTANTPHTQTHTHTPHTHTHTHTQSHAHTHTHTHTHTPNTHTHHAQPTAATVTTMIKGYGAVGDIRKAQDMCALRPHCPAALRALASGPPPLPLFPPPPPPPPPPHPSPPCASAGPSLGFRLRPVVVLLLRACVIIRVYALGCVP